MEYSPLKIFVCWFNDDIERRINLSTVQDLSPEIKKLYQIIEHGNQVWNSWAMRIGGKLDNASNSGGIIEIPADKLEDLPALRLQFGELIDSKISVGVGTELHEANQALDVAKKRGGNTIVLWSPELQEELEEKEKPKDSVDELAEKQFDKAESLNQGAGSGMQGATRPSTPTIDKPKKEGSEHSEAETLAHQIDDAPKQQEMTNAEASLEDKLHELAQQDQSQKADPPKTATLKSQIVQVLQQVKQAAPILEKIAQSAPEVYQSVMAMTQAVIAMARELPTDTNESKITSVSELDANAQMSKNEELEKMAIKDLKSSNTSVDPSSLPKFRESSLYSGVFDPQKDNHFDYSHLLSPEQKNGGYKMFVVTIPSENGIYHEMGAFVHHKGKEIGGGTGWTSSKSKELHMDTTSLSPSHRGKGLGSAIYEALYSHAYHKHGARRVSGSEHSTLAHKVHQRLAQKHGLEYDIHDDEEGPNFISSRKSGSFDSRYPKYSYALKSEFRGKLKEAIKRGILKAEALGGTKRNPNDFDPDSLEEGVKVELEHTKDREIAKQIAMDHLSEDKEYYKKLKTIEKEEMHFAPGKLPKAGAKHSRTHLIAPIGTHKDPDSHANREVGKVKVQDASDGRVHWIEARAGQVMGKEGHTISARTPNGK